MIRPVLFVIAVLATSTWADSYPVVLTAWSSLIRYEAYRGQKWNTAVVGNNRQSTNAYIGEQVVWATAPPATGPALYAYQSAILYFYGTGVKFRGFWNDPTNSTNDTGILEVLVDRSSSTNSTGNGVFTSEPVVLAESGFDLGFHTVQLMIRSGTVSLVSVEVLLEFPGITRAALENSAAQAYRQSSALRAAGNDNGNGSLIYTVEDDNPHGVSMSPTVSKGLQYNDQWTIDPDTNHSIYTETQGSSVSLRLKAGTVFLRINGTVGYNCGGSKLNIVPVPQAQYGISDNVLGSRWPSVFTNNTPNHEATICYAILDPTVRYNITLFSISPRLGVHSFELWTVPSPTRDRLGPIAGGVVGGVIGLVIIGILIFVRIRSRSRKRRAAWPFGKGENTFEVDDNVSENDHIDSTAAPTVASNQEAKGRMAQPAIIRNLRRAKPKAPIPHHPMIKHGEPRRPDRPARRGSPPDGAASPQEDTSRPQASGSNPPGPIRIVYQEEDAGILRPVSRSSARRIGPPTYSARDEAPPTHNRDASDDTAELPGVPPTTKPRGSIDMVEPRALHGTSASQPQSPDQ